jgi:hypothetical protein
MYKRVVRVLIDDSQTCCKNPQEEAYLSELFGFLHVDPCDKGILLSTVVSQGQTPLLDGRDYQYKIVLHRNEAVSEEWLAGKHARQWLVLLNVECGKTAHFFPELDACLRAIKNVCD